MGHSRDGRSHPLLRCPLPGASPLPCVHPGGGTGQARDDEALQSHRTINKELGPQRVEAQPWPLRSRLAPSPTWQEQAAERQGERGAGHMAGLSSFGQPNCCICSGGFATWGWSGL